MLGSSTSALSVALTFRVVENGARSGCRTASAGLESLEACRMTCRDSMIKLSRRCHAIEEISCTG